ncbi:MAG: hypothetical protein ACKO4A_12630 [Gammaproteobacteria bacterium]
MPREIQGLGMHDLRQVLFKPYRVIYRTAERGVLVYLLCDGRRELQGLLSRRLLSTPSADR